MDRIETNFRLALLSIEEVRLATANMAKVVEENQKAISEAISQQVQAINSLGTAMATSLEGFNIYVATQDALVAKVARLERDVAELKERAS